MKNKIFQNFWEMDLGSLPIFESRLMQDKKKLVWNFGEKIFQNFPRKNDSQKWSQYHRQMLSLEPWGFVGEVWCVYLGLYCPGTPCEWSM